MSFGILILAALAIVIAGLFIVVARRVRKPERDECEGDQDEGW